VIVIPLEIEIVSVRVYYIKTVEAIDKVRTPCALNAAIE